MSTLVPEPRVPRGLLATNPVARLLAGGILALGVVLTLSASAAGVVLAAELVVLAALRLPARVALPRLAAVTVAALLAGVTIALYGRGSGEVYVDFLLARVSDGSLALALVSTLRILAVGLPAVFLLLNVDATDLADGLIQRLRLPTRPVIAALAGFRLVSLFGEDWRTVGLARRARGVADRGRARRVLGQAFTLLVLAVRRGSDLATAMEARGFGAPVARSHARSSPWGAAEWGVLAGALLIAATGLTIAALRHEWVFSVG